jgi:hypothetical protein
MRLARESLVRARAHERRARRARVAARARRDVAAALNVSVLCVFVSVNATNPMFAFAAGPLSFPLLESLPLPESFPLPASVALCSPPLQSKAKRLG